MKQRDALSQFIFNFALEYSIRNVQEYHKVLVLNGTHQHLVFDCDINMVDVITNTVRKNIEALLEASKEDGLK
jgi:hypothetical protein